MNEIVYLCVDELYAHPDNPRKDLGELNELAESIKANGIMQNLTVVNREGGGYTVIIGHRRCAAAKLAGVEHVPCVVVEMDAQTQVATMMTENLQRADLTAYEQAQGFKQLSMDFGMSAEKIAEKTGFSATTVRRRLKLGNLNEDTLRRVTKRAAEKGRQLSMADLEAVADIEDENKRTSVLTDIGTDNFNMRLKAALKEQEEERNRRMWRELLKARGLVEIPQNKVWDSAIWKTCTQQREDLRKPTEEAVEALFGQWIGKDAQYGFAFHYGWLYIKENISVKKKEEETAGASISPVGGDVEEKEASNAEKGRKEAELRKLACSRLEKAFENAYELRRVFIDGMSEEVGKRVLPHMVELSVKMTEIDASSAELYEEEAAAIRRRLERKPHAATAYLLYAQFGDTKRRTAYVENYPYNKLGEFNGEDCDLEYLQTLYAGLVAMGYGMSDEEKELLDGTSKLYYHEGYGEEEDDGHSTADAEIPTETSAERVMTRFEAYKAMSNEEMDEVIGDRDTVDCLFRRTVRDCDDPAEVAEETKDFFCCSDGDCPDTSMYCGDCIEKWLREPYESKL